MQSSIVAVLHLDAVQRFVPADIWMTTGRSRILPAEVDLLLKEGAGARRSTAWGVSCSHIDCTCFMRQFSLRRSPDQKSGLFAVGTTALFLPA